MISLDAPLSCTPMTVVKSGTRIHLDEKDALDLAKELNVPAPRVHESSVTADGIVSIRMGYVEGENLEDIWADMSEEDRQDICRQLQEIIAANLLSQRLVSLGPATAAFFESADVWVNILAGPFRTKQASITISQS